MDVIIISGKQGSGKTTLQKGLGKTLFQKYNKRVEYINFADVIYEIETFAKNVLARYGIHRDLVKDGPLLQLLGTEWGRKTIDENIWCKIAANRCKEAEGKGVDVVIIGDCRFPNEFDFFPQALSIRLECAAEIRKSRCSMWRENTNHPSEVSLDKYSELDQFKLTLFTDLLTAEETLEKVIEFFDLGSKPGPIPHGDNL